MFLAFNKMRQPSHCRKLKYTLCFQNMLLSVTSQLWLQKINKIVLHTTYHATSIIQGVREIWSQILYTSCATCIKCMWWWDQTSRDHNKIRELIMWFWYTLIITVDYICPVMKLSTMESKINCPSTSAHTLLC